MKKFIIKFLEKVSWQIDKLACKMHGEKVNSYTKNFDTSDLFIWSSPTDQFYDSQEWPEDLWIRLNDQYDLMNIFQEFIKGESVNWKIEEVKDIDDSMNKIFDWTSADRYKVQNLIITKSIKE